MQKAELPAVFARINDTEVHGAAVRIHAHSVQLAAARKRWSTVKEETRENKYTAQNFKHDLFQKKITQHETYGVHNPAALNASSTENQIGNACHNAPPR